MESRNKALTFLLALIPGVGQMYLGLFKKGIQILVLSILIRPVFDIIGIGSLGGILSIIIWCYAFFDTFDIAKKLDRGEFVKDSEFVLSKYMDGNQNEDVKVGFKGYSVNKSLWMLCGWALVIIGVLAIVNLTFGSNELYGLIKSYISTYFIPALLVVIGIYMLVRYRK